MKTPLFEKGFGSDNHAPAHPEILKSILEMNQGHAHSYGFDLWTERANELFKTHFGKEAKTYFVFNGTGANVLSLRAMMKSYQSCLCSDISHLNVDECAAPEFQAGKLIPCPTKNGKISLESLQKMALRKGDQHFAQVAVLSLTQPTELGTVYSFMELQELIQWAKSQGLLIHIDGARLSNAAHSLNLDFKTFTTDLGVDVVSFGGTKNGFIFGEAIVFLNKTLARDFTFLRKQSLQLPSKTRYISAQFATYLENGLWKTIAQQANGMAQLLLEKTKDIPGVEITQPVQSNAVFAKIPKTWVKDLRKEHFFYVWDENTFECRWMCSWDTKPEEIEAFALKLKNLSLNSLTT